MANSRARKWTPARILAEIRRRGRAGLPLNGRTIIRDIGGLHYAAQKKFGGWRTAVETAGWAKAVPAPRAPRGRHPWTRLELLQFLRDFEKEHGFAGAWRLERVKREGYIGFRVALRREFGTLRRAKELAGVKTWPLWTKERILGEILTLAQSGSQVSHGVLMRENRRLVYGATRTYGSWRNALKASGVVLPPVIVTPSGKIVVRRGPRRRWTREKILQCLRQESRAGMDLRGPEFRKRKSGLYQAALREFGRWRRTLRAAHVLVPPQRHPLSPWTREKIPATLQEESRAGRDLRSPRVEERNPRLFHAARWVFGGWRKALSAAGVPPPARRVRASKWSPEGVLATIREALEKRRDTRIASFLPEFGAIGYAARRHFGAISAAGGPPSRPRDFPWLRDTATPGIRRRGFSRSSARCGKPAETCE